nr:copper resistance protein CopD [uncultured Campylobacter sp.]
MQAIYPYAQLIHLICAIIFVGFLFFDVIIFSRAKKKLPAEIAQKAQQAITSVAIKIMPLCVLILILTGGMMMSNWVGSKAGGYFETNLQIAFMIKFCLAMVIVAAVIVNLSCKFIFKRPSPLGNIHPIALTLAAIIVLLAKVMFMV